MERGEENKVVPRPSMEKCREGEGGKKEEEIDDFQNFIGCDLSFLLVSKCFLVFARRLRAFEALRVFSKELVIEMFGVQRFGRTMFLAEFKAFL
jgi:hypothetical protein